MEKEIKEYKTSLAFRTALDVRLNSISKNENVSLERLRITNPTA